MYLQVVTSAAAQGWFGARADDLSQVRSAHSAVGGTGRGRRYATGQLNQAYAMLLSSHFQGCCRDLHSQAVAYIAGALTPTPLQSVVQVELSRGRKLDVGNPHPGNLGADFGRLGLDLWPKAYRHDPRNRARKVKLERLNAWRNAIAHQDFRDQQLQGRTSIRLNEVEEWQRACNGLVRTFDHVVADHVSALVGVRPW